jgi:hypothetical protein
VIFLYFGGFFTLEPFGLLNLLKSLLSNEQFSPAKEEEKQAEKEQTAPQKTPDEKPKTNACTAFLEAHERRKRKK